MGTTRVGTRGSRLAVAQAEAAPDALQILDTGAGLLPREDYSRLALPPAARAIADLRGTGLSLIYYSQKSADLVDLAAGTGADVLGVDQTIELRAARERVPDGVALQGNLDPRFLLRGRVSSRRPSDGSQWRARTAPTSSTSARGCPRRRGWTAWSPWSRR